jgi:D-alanine-D-alanine ligase
MRIGITYDLREDYIALGLGDEETAEFDRPDTIEALESALRDLGFETDRIGNIQSLAAKLVAGERWDMVFNIAEGLRGFGREAQVPGLLDAYNIPYTFSDSLVLALTLHKGMTKRVIRDLGIPTPDFSVVETVPDCDEVHLPFPVFAKPVAEGTGKGIDTASKIRTKQELKSVCERLLRHFDQPVLVEAFMPGREFTVGIVGNGKAARAIGCIEVVLRKEAEPEAYSYWNKKKYDELVEYLLVEDEMADRAIDVAMAAWRGLGCRDGGRVDLRADEAGVPRFLEVNPLAGLNPVVSDLPILCTLKGLAYRDLISMIMESALTRIGKTGPVA